MACSNCLSNRSLISWMLAADLTTACWRLFSNASRCVPEVCSTSCLYAASFVEAPCACSNRDRKSTRLNSSHGYISYAVFCLKKKKKSKEEKLVRNQRRHGSSRIQYD